MAVILEEEGMPNPGLVWKWRKIHPAFGEMYERARKDQMHAWSDQIITFADDGTHDVLRDGDGQPMLKKNGDPQLYREHIDRTRLKIETRKWLMAKIVPKVFGDKMKVEATHTVESMDDAEMVNQLNTAMTRAGMSMDDLVDILGQGGLPH